MHHSRRDILRVLAAFSLAPWLYSEQKKPAAAPNKPSKISCKPGQKPPSADDGTLNVIFHGPFCFIRYDDHIDAITPAAMGHVYGVGTWTQEYYLEKGTYYLLGVGNQPLIPGQDVDPTSALIFPQGVISEIDPQNLAYCTVVIPTPAKIGTLSLFKPPSGIKMFKGKNADYGNGIVEFGSSHVFTYLNVKTGDVKLSRTDWQPNTNDLHATNLHIIATPVFQLDLDHSVRTFHSSMQMLSNSSIEMNREVITGDFQYLCPEDSCWPGVSSEEQLPLHLRFQCGQPLLPPRICDAASAFVTT